MIEFVTSEWKTRKQIELECNMQGIKFDDRKLRKEIEYNNEQFYSGKTNVFVAHSEKGYKTTTDIKELTACAQDHHVRQRTHLHHYYKIMRRVNDMEREALMGGLDGRS